MNLKVKSAIWFTVIVSIILALSFITIYLLYADFRKDDFYQRLRDKCASTYKLLLQVEEIDHNMFKLIDRNSLNALYDERVLIFDSTNTIIYSSVDDQRVTYSKSMLERIREKKEITTKEGEKEVLGMMIDEGTNHYIVLASAYDVSGRRKLENLEVILLSTFLAGVLLTSILSFVYAKRILHPLELLSEQVQAISENNLKERLQIRDQKNEISALAKNFNQLLDRLDRAFITQKSFVNHASHELRTPIASMISQTESALSKNLTIDEYRASLESLLDDQQELGKLVNSLLLLSKYEQVQFNMEWKSVRLDEIIYKSIADVQPLYPGFNIVFDFVKIPEDAQVLSLYGQEILLQSAFGNLIKNACHYSTSHSIELSLDFDHKELVVRIMNAGPTLSGAETEQLFTPFFRGDNASHKKGFGLGLSICKRIVSIHRGVIEYSAPEANMNQFTIRLPRALSNV